MCRLSSPASRAACCAAVGESERRLFDPDRFGDHAAAGDWRPELLREAARRATAGDGGASVDAGDADCIERIARSC